MDHKSGTRTLPPGLERYPTRRQVFRGASAVLLSSGVLALVGCGGSGGGGGSSPSSMKAVSGTVTLPVGVDPTKLAVAGGLGTSALKNGKFSVSVPDDAPSLVSVYDPATAKVLLMGMADPAVSGTLTIDSTSTASALLFFALGGSSMPRDGMKPLLEVIKSSGATTTLAGVIASRVQADPFAVGKGDAQIVSSLSTAAHAIAPSVTGSIRRTPAQGSVPTLLQIQPTGEVNGVTYLLDDKITGYAVQNTKRRTGFGFTYLTGHVDAKGVQTPVDPPVQAGGTLEIPSTSSLLKLGSGWSPVTSATVPLELQGSDAKSVYTLVYLTQVYGGDEPVFFSDTRWSAEVAQWRTSLRELGQDNFVGFVANVILSAIGFGGLAWTHAQLAEAITALRTIPSISTLIDLAAGGNVLLGDMARQTLQEFLDGDVSQELLKDMATLVRSTSKAAADYLAQGAARATAMAAIKAAVGALIVSGALLLAGDLGAVAIDTSTGDKGDLWTATVVKQTLILSPHNPTASPGDRVHFSVRPPSGMTGKIEYDWTETGTFATLSSSDGKVGKSITTSSQTVDLVTTASDSGTITVTVTGYLVEGSTRTEFGTAQSKVGLSGSGSGADGTFTITVSGSVDPNLPDGTYIDTNCTGAKVDNEFVIESLNSPLPFNLAIETTNGELGGTYPLGSVAPCFVFNNLIHPVDGGDKVTVTPGATVGGKTQYTFSFQASEDLGAGYVLRYNGGGTVSL
ncbi:MAG TPA: hypothetical protein VG944_15950 [Fimbriimonas sp.]|nr:hypothetical protein [Fimbriimonas sp.]